MKPYTLHHADNLAVLRSMPDNSVDSIVTDPPYGLSFMGKKWDYDVPSSELWAECLRVLKPGGHLLAFAGTRTQHRMAVRIEDAGFEIRDMIAWVYGSGFPKSLDVSKAIDKAAGVQRPVTPTSPMRAASEVGSISKNLRCAVCGKARSSGNPCVCPRLEDNPITDAAHQWQGWGTALKPSMELITVARKPFDVTVAENVLTHGTGALNIDGCRVPGVPPKPGGQIRATRHFNGSEEQYSMVDPPEPNQSGRWPANLIHDGSEEVVAGFPVTGPSKAAPRGSVQRYDPAGADAKRPKGGNNVRGIDDAGGSAARFFYCAKASKADRDEGCDSLPLGPAPGSKRSQPAEGRSDALGRPRANHHPTVKPTDLMRYLCRLVTPPGGVVLDPFMGSGSTGKAAMLEGFGFIGIEREADYVTIAERRIAAVSTPQPEPEEDKQQRLFGGSK